MKIDVTRSDSMNPPGNVMNSYIITFYELAIVRACDNSLLKGTRFQPLIIYDSDFSPTYRKFTLKFAIRC